MDIEVAESKPAHASARTQGPSAQSEVSEQYALETLFEISKLLTGAIDPVAAMPGVFSILSAFMGLEHGSLALMAEPNGAARDKSKLNPFSIAATQLGTDPNSPSLAPGLDRVARMVFLTGVPLVSLDVVGEFGADALPKGAKDDKFSMVAVPIRAELDRPLIIGVLTVFRSYDDNAEAEVANDLRVMSMAASLLEQALRFRRAVARDRERMFRETGNALKAARNETVRDDGLRDDQGIVGDSEAICAVLDRIHKVAKTSTAVLLRGESGTGKELFAQAIHQLSDRSGKPFVKVNCAALSETLLETELFGHEKGSFTGAAGQRKGRFEMAHGGTLFLDEIGEISHEFQTKLLRVLQEGEFERVGGTKTLKVDVRLVTATNRDLEEAVASGDFRADLYFRICVVPIQLPPLRDRPEDIPDLARTFLERFNEENGTAIELSLNAMETLTRCRFPGNVRELENCVNRSAALCEDEVIQDRDMACNQGDCLSAVLWRMQNSPIGGIAATPAQPANLRPVTIQPLPKQRKTADTERDELVQAMEQAGWVQAKAARLLGLTPRQIGYALKKHKIEIKKI